jgi:gluconokinase
MDRMLKRQGHFMKANMLESQLQTLESPEGEDGVVVVPMEGHLEEQVKLARDGLSKLVDRCYECQETETTNGKACYT